MMLRRDQDQRQTSALHEAAESPLLATIVFFPLPHQGMSAPLPLARACHFLQPILPRQPHQDLRTHLGRTLR
jgi:hypothetical protein